MLGPGSSVSESNVRRQCSPILGTVPRNRNKTDNLIAQGEACCNLGVIYNQRGEFSKAVQLFEKNFEIARSTVVSGKGDRSLVDTARVNLGMARGNAQMQTYMNIINHDLTTLLRWKNRRVKFEV